MASRVGLTRITQAIAERYPRVQNAFWRLLWKGHPPGHFYSPIPSTAERGNGCAAQTALSESPNGTEHLAGIDLRCEDQRTLLEQLGKYAGEFSFPQHETGEFRFFRENGYYTDPDAVVLFCMLRHLSPRHVVEVGSGHSSALVLDTIERYVRRDVECVFIDPNPERLHTLVGGTNHSAEILDKGVQQIGMEVFGRLEDGDILLIDSSHVMKHGSDVCHLLFEVLPILSSGVYVHLHDVCYPFEYPRNWLTSGRAWNEAYALRCFLEFNDRFQIALWNHFAGMAYPQLLQPFDPYLKPGEGCSLWIRRA
jgi:Methyltransferase domain